MGCALAAKPLYSNRDNKMKLVIYLSFAFLSNLFLSCSSVQSLNSFNNDYMPLAIGNKWLYNVHPSNVEAKSEISFTSEIISIDTIEGKKYFKFKYENVNPNIPPTFYYQRSSNDTLYTLNYDEERKKYIERVSTIFTLDSNEVALIKLNIEEKETGNKIERLPTINRYSIKAIKKDDDKIELFTDRSLIDGNYTEIYKRGIGMIKSKNDWGIITELIDYDLKN